MTSPSPRREPKVEVRDQVPALNTAVARLLAAIVVDAASRSETEVVELRIGHSPEAPEAVAS